MQSNGFLDTREVCLLNITFWGLYIDLQGYVDSYLAKYLDTKWIIKKYVFIVCGLAMS